MNGFSDHFSKTAAAYASYRPDYPPELVAWIAAQAPARARVGLRDRQRPGGAPARHPLPRGRRDRRELGAAA